VDLNRIIAELISSVPPFVSNDLRGRFSRVLGHLFCSIRQPPEFSLKAERDGLAAATTVDKAGGIPDIKETQDYVDGIMKRMK
jgi:hypothetical protein